MSAQAITWQGAEYLRGQLVPIDSLEPWPDNPRRGDVNAVRESFRRFGQKKPVVVRGSTIVAGHHMVLAALELGWTHIAVGEGDFEDDEDARGFLLADNRTSELGFIDEEALSRQLQEMRSTDGLGYSDKDRAELDARLARLRAPAEEPPLPPAPEDADSKPGEVYELGPHRVMCGDARDPEQVANLMDGAAAEVIWTDPPYGVSYVGKTSRALTIQNDDGRDLATLLRLAFRSCDAVFAPGGRFYIAAPAGPKGTTFRLAVAETGWLFHQALVWVKDRFVLGHSDYHYRHEDVLYGWKPGEGRPGRGDHAGSRWYGGNGQDSVFEVPRPSASEEHPTMKPVELVRRHLANSSMEGDAILDPFGGSGTTLLAAETSGRVGYLLELDPAYCDVIRKRYAEYVQRPDLAPPGANT